MLLSTMVESHQRLVEIAITQMNLLICLLNDMIDYYLIESGQFKCYSQSFDPTELFEFIVNMFSSQAKIQQTKLSLFVINPPITPQSHLDLFLGKNNKAHLPALLSGDKMRL